MINGDIRARRAGCILMAAAVAVIGWGVRVHADDECLVQFQDQQNNSKLKDSSQLCAVASGKTCTYGKSPGAACTPVGSLMTSNDCLPSLGGFQAPLGVDLTPLTTGEAEKTDPAGSFCPSQTTAGAFGQATARRIAETGTPAGNLSDMAAHPSVLASVFCIPATGNPAVDGVSDLPGPGAIGLNGVMQLH